MGAPSGYRQAVTWGSGRIKWARPGWRLDMPHAHVPMRAVKNILTRRQVAIRIRIAFRISQYTMARRHSMNSISRIVTRTPNVASRKGLGASECSSHVGYIASVGIQRPSGYAVNH